jgi:hypothetical protein
MMRMIKMTRNITRFKITSDLQIKHELASNKKRYIRTTTPGLAKVKIYLYYYFFMAIFEPYGSKLYKSWQINQFLYLNYKFWG